MNALEFLAFRACHAALRDSKGGRRAQGQTQDYARLVIHERGGTVDEAPARRGKPRAQFIPDAFDNVRVAAATHVRIGHRRRRRHRRAIFAPAPPQVNKNPSIFRMLKIQTHHNSAEAVGGALRNARNAPLARSSKPSPLRRRKSTGKPISSASAVPSSGPNTIMAVAKASA